MLWFFPSKFLRGALTNKAWVTVFNSRPWELQTVSTIDVLDSLNSNIEISIRGGQFIRILPNINYRINGEWISDRVRYSIDSFRTQRLDEPLFKYGALKTFEFANRRFITVSWRSLLEAVASCSYFGRLNFFRNVNWLFPKKTTSLRFLNISASLGLSTDVITSLWFDRLYDIFCLNPLISSKKINFFDERLFCETGTVSTDLADPFDLRKYSNIFIVAPSMPSTNPLLMSQLRHMARVFGAKLFLFGPRELNLSSDLGCPEVSHVGSLSDYLRVLSGQHWLSLLLLPNSVERSLLLVSSDTVAGDNLFGHTKQVMQQVRLTNVDIRPFHQSSTSIHSSMVGLPNLLLSELDYENSISLFNYSCSLITKGSQPVGPKSQPQKQSGLLNLYSNTEKHIHLGTHADLNLLHPKVVFPISSFFESELPFINLLGNTQWTSSVISAPGKSINPNYVLILLYSRICKTFDSKTKNMFFTYFLDYFVRLLTLINNIQLKLKILHILVDSGITKCMTFSVFLKDCLTPIMLHIFLVKNYVDIFDYTETTDSSGIPPTIRRVSTFGLSLYQSAGHLGFQDELSVNSPSLRSATLELTDNSSFKDFLNN